MGVGRLECELTMFQSLLETIAGDTRLSAEQIEFIRSLWMPRDFRKGQFFQRAGEVTTHGAFVVRGCFRTYMVDARGGETIVHFSAERAFIGDITSAVTGQPTPYSVDAVEPSTILTIDHASFNRMLEQCPDIARGYRLAYEAATGKTAPAPPTAAAGGNAKKAPGANGKAKRVSGAPGNAKKAAAASGKG